MAIERFHLREANPIQLAAVCATFICRIQQALPCAEVQEVGSTALGCIGKQDIDILVRVNPDKFVQARQCLDTLFQRDEQQMANTCYQAYVLSREPDVAIQLTIKDGPHDVFLPFLDALRTDPALLQKYEKLKRRWDGQPMQAYRRAKARFIRRVLKMRAATRENRSLDPKYR